MSPDDIGAGASYIDITGVDDNSTTTIAIGLSDEVSMINGYTTTLTEGTDCTTYKVHVLSVFGGAISSDADMFYLYYYPKNKTIKLVMSEGLEYYFSK